MTDRAVQDEVIRALADARYRASPAWRARDLAPAERVERFARFLARHFYAQRVVHFFRYSRALGRATGRMPEVAIWSSGFDALVPEAVLGSRDTATRVGALVVEDQRRASERLGLPYLDDLLRYQEAMLVVEAGPRDWSRSVTAEPDLGPDDVAELVEGTILLEPRHDLPAVLPTLLGPWTEPPPAPPGPVSLVVARTRHGRVSVVRVDEATATLLPLADGTRTSRQIAEEAGMDPERLRRTFGDLVDVGAVRFSTGS